jgi:membrane dipeptidase
MAHVQAGSSGTGTPPIHGTATIIDGVSNSVLTREQHARFRRGGVTAVNHAAIDHGVGLDPTLLALTTLLREVETLDDCYLIVRSASDIGRASDEGRVGVILGLQDGRPLEDRIEYAQVLHAMGVRIIQLTYNRRNLIGDGCLEPGNAGLSRFGAAAVKEMNRLGILIDLSHCGVRTTMEAIDVSEAPVAITHANPSTFSPSPRNKPDDVLRALAGRGGVIGLTTFSPLVARTASAAPTLDDFVQLVDHAVNLVGVDHVGIGTDHTDGVFDPAKFDKEWGWRAPLYRDLSEFMGPWYRYETKNVVGLESAADWGNLTEALLRRGYGEIDMQKILGGNFLRLFGRVWR